MEDINLESNEKICKRLRNLGKKHNNSPSLKEKPPMSPPKMEASAVTTRSKQKKMEKSNEKRK